MITLMDEIKEQLENATPVTEERIQSIIENRIKESFDVDEEGIRERYPIGQKIIYFLLEKDHPDSEKQGINNTLIEVIKMPENKLSDIGEIYTFVPGRGTPKLPRLIYTDDEIRQESYKLWIEGNPPF